MRRIIAGLILFSATAWPSDIRSDEVRGAHWLTTAGAVPRVTALGQIDQSKLSCTAGNPGTCTLYDDTAATGVSSWYVRAGINQGAAPTALVYFLAAGGGAMGGINFDNTIHTLGGWTNAFPAIKRSGADMQVRLADDTLYAYVDTLGVKIGGAGTGSRYLKGNATAFVISTGAASGTGGCGAGSVVTGTNDDAAPTCATPASLGYVLGAANLTTADRMVKVSAAGTVTESPFAILTGSPVTMTLYDNTAVTGASGLTIRSGISQAAWISTFTLTDNPATTSAFFSPLAIQSTAINSNIQFGRIGINLSGGSGELSFHRYQHPWAAGTAIFPYGLGVLSVSESGASNKWAGLTLGTIALQSLATPAAPVVTPTCVPGACNLTWSYNVAAVLGDGTSTEVGAVGSTALQNGTINAASYNTLTVAPVAGATSYRWYRTVSAGIPATLGLIGTTAAPTLVDNGLAGDTVLGPTVNATGRATIGTGGIMFATDGVGNIGEGANRPRTINASYSITAPYITATGWYRALEIATDSGIPDLLLHDTPRTGFGCLQFGGVTNAYGALCRNGSGLKVRVASDDAWGHLAFKRANWMNDAEGGCATGANLVVDAVDNTKVTSATYNFVAADIGGRVQVTAGAGWTVGDYMILSAPANAAILSSSPAPVGTAGGTWTVNRGRVVLVEGILGVAADTFRVCTADAAGALAYRALY
jgi:hypothetical protein